MCGVGTSQWEEASEALLLSACIHEGSGSDAGNGANRTAEVASLGLVVASSEDELTVENLLLLVHELWVQRDVFVLHFL